MSSKEPCNKAGNGNRTCVLNQAYRQFSVSLRSGVQAISISYALPLCSPVLPYTFQVLDSVAFVCRLVQNTLTASPCLSFRKITFRSGLSMSISYRLWRNTSVGNPIIELICSCTAGTTSGLNRMDMVVSKASAVGNSTCSKTRGTRSVAMGSGAFDFCFRKGASVGSACMSSARKA